MSPKVLDKGSDTIEVIKGDLKYLLLFAIRLWGIADSEQP